LGREDGLRWLVRGGWMGALWRVLLFGVLLLALIQLQLLILVSLVDLEAWLEITAQALLVQGLVLFLAAVLAGWIMLRWIDRRHLRELGFALDRRVPRDLAVGLGVGAAALVAVVLMLTLVGAFRFTSAPGTVVGWLVASGTVLLWLALPAAAEEAIFRGYAFRTLVEGIGPAGATIITSVLFAVVHGANPNVSAFGYVNIFAAGVMLSLAVLWTGSLWFASALHLGWNWAMAGLLHLPVSGLELFETPLYEGVATGPGWLTGGAFGPEGGVAGSLAVATAVALMWWYLRPGGRGDTSEHERDQHVSDR
jgi:uncharacterized protein